MLLLPRHQILIALSARIAVRQLVLVPRCKLLRVLLLDLLVGQILHASSIYLVQSSPAFLEVD